MSFLKTNRGLVTLTVTGILGSALWVTNYGWPDWSGIGGRQSVSRTIENYPDEHNKKIVETTIYEPGKSLWDWLELLGVPTSLALLGYIFQHIQEKRAAEAEEEEVLQSYFDRISSLLIDKNILPIVAKAEKGGVSLEQKELLNISRDVIRARTLSTLRKLDRSPQRKGSVIQFLIDIDLINKGAINLLSEADLKGASLWCARLRGANLEQANLQSANLKEADLRGANLYKANLQGADLQSANLKEADLWKANLEGTNLEDTNLEGTNLEGTNLEGAILCKANLQGANLWKTALRKANLQDALLEGANFRGADLQGAVLWGARYSDTTQFPIDFKPETRNMEYVKDSF